MRRPATTANALLGLLALRPAWSTWELTQQLRRNMRFFWPRADSQIFAEARQLEVRGLARAERSYVGRRPRTTYSITAEGHEALRQWLSTPPGATSLECEPLLRVMLGDLDDTRQIEVALEQIRADAHAILAVGRVVGPEYLHGTSPFQDQVHVRAHVFDFLSHHALMLLDWADRTEALLQQCSRAAATERDAAALQLIEACLSKFPDPGVSQPDQATPDAR